MASKRRSRHLKRNPDSRGSVLVVGGLVVGGYFVWKHFDNKSKAAPSTATPPAAIVGGVRSGGVLMTDPSLADAWSAYDKRKNKAQDVMPLDRATFDRFWGTLTSDEKRLFVAMSRATDAESTAMMSSPSQGPMVMGIVMKIMAVAPRPSASQTSTSAPSEGMLTASPVSCLGNYVHA